MKPTALSTIADIYRPISAPPAMWEDQSAALIRDALYRVQAVSDTTMRRYWRILHALLDGEHQEALEERLAITHPNRAAQWNEGDPPSGHRYFPLVPMYVDRLSVVFHTPAETYLYRAGDPSREPLDKADPQAIQWRLDEDDCELDTTLAQAERWVNGMQQAIVQPALVKGRMRWIVHAPYEVYVEQDPEDPGRLETATHVLLQVTPPTDTSNNNPSLMYLTWERTDVRDANGRVTDTRWSSWFHDAAGRLHTNPLFLDNVNGYGLHPFVVWRQKRPAPGSFWIVPNAGWIHQALSTDLKMMDLDWIARFQVFSMGVSRGNIVGQAEIGPDKILTYNDTAADADFKFVTPDPKLEELEAAIAFDLRMAAVAEGLPPDTFEPNSSTRNLGAKQLEQHALMMRREAIVPEYLRALRRTFEVHKAVGNYWAKHGVKRTAYDDDIRLGVNLAPIPYPSDRFQSTQALALELSLNLGNPIDELMIRGGVNRAEATRRLERNKETNAKYAPPPPEPAVPGVPLKAAAGEGVERPASVQE